MRKSNKRKIQVPKECFFCKEKLAPVFRDTANLEKFTTDRGKILARAKTGLCAMHQRRLTTAVKYARHLALMPFVVN